MRGQGWKGSGLRSGPWPPPEKKGAKGTEKEGPGRESGHYIGLRRRLERGEPGNVRCLASLWRKGRGSMPGKREKVAPEFHFAAVGEGPFLLKKSFWDCL